MTDDLGPLRIVRPDDLLNVTVELTNLRVSADRHFLERIDLAAPAWLALVLPPQHLSEQAFMEYKDHVERAAQPPVGYVAAGPSRLVFSLPTSRYVKTSSLSVRASLPIYFASALRAW